MNKKNLLINFSIAFGLSFLCFLIIAKCLPLVFTLIDDNIIEEVISGTFTGTPDGHAVYIKYILAFFLSRLYYIKDSVPWYGLFLIGIQAGCVFLMIYRLCSFLNKVRQKIICSFAFLIFFISYIFNGLVFFTYTSVAALLTSTAIFWFLTIDNSKSKKILIQNYLLFIVIVLIAFCLRSNILIMLAPFILLSFIIYVYPDHTQYRI